MGTPSETARAGGVRLERIDYGAPVTERPRVSIIVPSLDGERRGLLARLLEDLELQTLPRFELLLIVGDDRQGRAINRGAAAARGDIIVTMDDDTIVRTPRLLANLVAVLDDLPAVGMVGASTVLPEGASRFQHAASRQIPRRLFPIVEEVVDSDMVQHPCLAMRKEQFFAVGGEDEELMRGLDPLLRFKVREAGWRVVIAPQTAISHPLPDGLWAVLRMYYRNGRGSAFAQKNYPDRIYNLSDGFCRNRLRARVPFFLRTVRYPLRLARSLLGLRWIRLSVEVAYLLGYVGEWTRRGARTHRAAHGGPG